MVNYSRCHVWIKIFLCKYDFWWPRVAALMSLWSRTYSQAVLHRVGVNASIVILWQNQLITARNEVRGAYSRGGSAPVGHLLPRGGGRLVPRGCLVETPLERLLLQAVRILLQWRILDFPSGGAPTPKVGPRTYFFGQKLHENERILAPGGGARPWRPHLDLPLYWIAFLFAHELAHN